MDLEVILTPHTKVLLSTVSVKCLNVIDHTNATVLCIFKPEKREETLNFFLLIHN